MSINDPLSDEWREGAYRRSLGAGFGRGWLLLGDVLAWAGWIRERRDDPEHAGLPLSRDHRPGVSIAHIIGEALCAGELRAAGIDVGRGDFVAIARSVWAAHVTPSRPPYTRGVAWRAEPEPQWRRVLAAGVGRDDDVIDRAKEPARWLRPALAFRDLVDWAGLDLADVEEPRRPDDWPADEGGSAPTLTNGKQGTPEDWFALGYAVACMDTARKLATRDNIEKAGKKRGLRAARLRVGHQRLPADLKDMSRVPGGKGPAKP